MLIKQDEALAFQASLSERALRELLTYAKTEVLFEEDSLEGDFDMLFFYKVLEAVSEPA